MAEPSSEQTGEKPDFGEGPPDQAMIDAVLQGTGDTAGEQPVRGADALSDSGTPSSQEINQADVDALLQASAVSDAPGESDQTAGSPAPDRSEAAADLRSDTPGSPSDEASSARSEAIETGQPVAVKDEPTTQKQPIFINGTIPLK